MKNKDMALVINTPSGKNTREDEVKSAPPPCKTASPS
jgi:hypothetical protein